MLILHSRVTLLYPEGKRRGELASPYLSSVLPMEPSRTVLFQSHPIRVSLHIANMQYMPHVTSSIILKPLYALLIEMSPVYMVWMSWQCQIAIKVLKRLYSVSVLTLSWATNEAFVDGQQCADHAE